MMPCLACGIRNSAPNRQATVGRDSLLTQRTKRFVQLHNSPDRERWPASIALTNSQPASRALPYAANIQSATLQ